MKCTYKANTAGGMLMVGLENGFQDEKYYIFHTIFKP